MRWTFVMLMIVVMAGLFNVAGADRLPEPEMYDTNTHFMPDPEPTPVAVTGNPLDYTGQRIGLPVRAYELPRAYENNYRLACRFPLIDFVSNQPLYMKQWSEDTSHFLLEKQREQGLEAVVEALRVLRGTGENMNFSMQLGPTAMNDLDRALAGSNLSPRFQQTFKIFYRQYLDAWHLTQQAKAGIAPEDLDFFYENPGYFIVPDGTTMPSLTGSVDSHFNFIERARGVSYELIFSAAETLIRATQEFVNATADWPQADFWIDPARASEDFVWESTYGRLVIAGFGSNTHTQDAAILIDLGGDDNYSNNAGATLTDLPADVNKKHVGNATLCLDYAGNDVYRAADRRYAQGLGFLGVGLLIDLDGSDEYEAEHFSQGAGIMGVGVLWDRTGNDAYIGQAFCQGAGMFGLGMLLDDDGEDVYDIATLGQGGATTLGLGILSDLNGDDRYLLAIGDDKDALGRAPGYGQGGALSFRHLPWRQKLTAYGGVGMLLDCDGNDRYWTKGWCDQGGSYIMSLGVLYDEQGNDHYSAHCGQGSGIHITNAILIDQGGHDIYEGEFRSGGSGGDRSPGFLLDYSGNDTYRSKTSSYGTGVKPFSYSLLIDYEGADTYICPEPEDAITFNNWDSFGGVWPESEPYHWPYAIHLDLGGDDDYQVRNRANNSERHSFGHGIHLDQEWRGGDVIGTVENPLPPYERFPLPESVLESPFGNDIRLLQHPDTFVRFQAIGRLSQADPGVLTHLVEAILASEHRQFNRDAMECIHYHLVNGTVTDAENSALIRLLKSKDAEIRTIMADNFGIWDFLQIATAEEPLIDVAKTDSVAAVRRFALASLARLESQKALPLARDLAKNDPDPQVRRVATRFLTVVRDDTDPYPLLADLLQHDSASQVKVAAARGIGDLQAKQGVDVLRAAAQTDDAYVQRAAGRSLAELGQVEGIGLLIESLSFPSIDAFDNYGYNVPNFIAAYAGHDLPEGERYNQTQWRDWFAANKEQIDIEGNVAAYHAFEAVKDSVRGLSTAQQISAYEAFLAKYPKHQGARLDLARMLNSEAWTLVTAPSDTDAFDPETGLKYALRAVELNDHLNYVDTLAEAYLANRQYEKSRQLCEETLEKHPDEKMFLDRLERLQQLQKER